MTFLSDNFLRSFSDAPDWKLIIVWTFAYPIQQEPGYWVKPNVLKQYVFTVWRKSSKPTVYWLTGSNLKF